MAQIRDNTQGWKNAIAVSVGAIGGAEMRYGVGEIVKTAVGQDASYVGTLAVNWVGCLILAAVLTLNEGPIKKLSARAQLMLTTGFCGAFTTFSTYILETNSFLLQNQPDMAMLYGFGSAIGGLFACGLGVAITRRMKRTSPDAS
jgi:fluoride exporter